jgi:hypothetical protein
MAAATLTPALGEAQICAGLPPEYSQVLSVAAAGRDDKAPFTDLQYVGATYGVRLSRHVTLSANGQIPLTTSDPGFDHVAGELSAAFPGVVGLGCPVLTGGLRAASETQSGSSYLSAGYGIGKRWDRSKAESWFAVYAIPAVFVDRTADRPGGASSTRIRFGSDVGFLIASGAQFYIGGGLRRAFLDGGGGSIEAKIGWAF